MSKELEEFYTLRAAYCVDEFSLRPYEIERFKIIETALKAFEIIKEKGLDILEFRHAFSLYEYNACKSVGCEELTQEEYDLLKKVLK